MIAGIFTGNRACCKPRGLKGHSLCEGIPVVSSERLGPSPPLGRVSGRTTAGWIRHADTGAKCRSHESARIQKRFVDVITELVFDPGRLGIRSERPRSTIRILGPQMSGT